MESSGTTTIFELVGALILAVGLGWLVIQTFRKNIWMGIAAVILLPIAMFIMPFIHGRKAVRPGLLLLAGVLFFGMGDAAQTGNGATIGIMALILVGIFFAYRQTQIEGRQPPAEKKQPDTAASLTINPLSILGRLQLPIVKSAEEITFDSRRFNELIDRDRVFFETRGKAPQAKTVAKLFDKPEAIQSISNYNQRHLSATEAIRSASDINWRNEHFQLFAEIMKRKYQLGEHEAIAALLYVNDEETYNKYASTFDASAVKDPKVFWREIALSDIYAEREPNFRHIARLAKDIGAKIGSRPVDQQYAEVKQEIRLLQFEKNLSGDSTKRYRSIDQQIKTEKQLELINSRIGQTLSLEPADYIIVGPDYSRDSRIDAYYKAQFSYVLSRAFGGHCCRCGEGMGQLEFDHFWWPKSRGGNFIMRASNGVYVNNCIPLCRSCNSSKGARDFRDFFTEAEIIRIIDTSQSINAYINEQMIDFEDKDFTARVRAT